MKSLADIIRQHAATRSDAGERIKSCGEAMQGVELKIVDAEGARLSEHEIREFARARLAGYKIPKTVDFADALPRNPSGKILKRELRAPYLQGRERQVH